MIVWAATPKSGQEGTVYRSREDNGLYFVSAEVQLGQRVALTGICV